MQIPAFIMHIWKSSDSTQTVGILLFDAFSNHCLANAVEPLRAANTLARKQLYKWQFLSLTGGIVTSSSGLPVQTERALADHDGGDFLFIMPSYDFESHATPACSRALRAAASRFDTLVGMDMGSWLLAAAGLLDGCRATIHWDEIVTFAETFPDVDVTEDRIVYEGKILSCGGVTTTFELVLKLIEAQHGPMLGLEVSALFMYGEKATLLDARSSATRPEKVRMATAIMRRNIEAPLPVPDVAHRVGMNEKDFTQACTTAFGFGAKRLYQAIRLREARRLATQTALGVQEIAGRCGYQNASALTRAFKAEFGMTIRDARHRG